MTITVYQIEPSPPCRAVFMVAQQLGIKLNLKRLDLQNEEHLKPEFLKINPEHTVPTIDDDGFILWESRAILKYFVNKYAPDSPLYPKDPQQRAIVDRMLYCDLGLFNSFVPIIKSRFLNNEDESPEKYEAVHKNLQVLEDILKTNPYLAGNHITLADYSTIPIFTVFQLVDITLEKYPNITAWINKLKQEIPNFKEINEDPIEKIKGHVKSKK